MDYSEFRQDEINGWSQRAGGYGKATALATVQTIPTLLAAVRLYPGARMLAVAPVMPQGPRWRWGRPVWA